MPEGLRDPSKRAWRHVATFKQRPSGRFAVALPTLNGFQPPRARLTRAECLVHDVVGKEAGRLKMRPPACGGEDPDRSRTGPRSHTARPRVRQGAQLHPLRVQFRALKKIAACPHGAGAERTGPRCSGIPGEWVTRSTASLKRARSVPTPRAGPQGAAASGACGASGVFWLR